mmetsp:Transcript_49887/g.118950  ORF Transcript_49887/g.118950 Transcript_49887/m.118950 type:complete len:235 (+) Transcript_49887:610-1314(+)
MLPKLHVTFAWSGDRQHIDVLSRAEGIQACVHQVLVRQRVNEELDIRRSRLDIWPIWHFQLVNVYDVYLTLSGGPVTVTISTAGPSMSASASGAPPVSSTIPVPVLPLRPLLTPPALLLQTSFLLITIILAMRELASVATCAAIHPVVLAHLDAIHFPVGIVLALGGDLFRLVNIVRHSFLVFQDDMQRLACHLLALKLLCSFSCCAEVAHSHTRPTTVAAFALTGPWYHFDAD